MSIEKLFETLPKDHIYGLYANVSIPSSPNYYLVDSTPFKGTVATYLNNKKALSSLKMVMLNASYLCAHALDLSSSDIARVNLAHALLSSSNNIILNYFEKGLNYKEKENFKRLLKKLASDYHKTIIINTNDLEFIWDITTQIIVFNNQELIAIKTSEILANLSYFDHPQIIKLITHLKRRGLSLSYYKNVLDLLKAIYRLKGE